jgi:hypothetical protein
MFGIVGFFNGIQGLSAIFKKEYFSEEALVYQNLQLWGWIWLIVGVLQIAAAISLFSGRGRVLGIVLAAGSAVVSFTSIGAYPLWSILVIAIDILIIYGLTLQAPTEYETDMPRGAGSTGDDMRPPIMQR